MDTPFGVPIDMQSNRRSPGDTSSLAASSLMSDGRGGFAGASYSGLDADGSSSSLASSRSGNDTIASSQASMIDEDEQISEEFEEELEPQLKYEKLGAELREISSNEKTTCMTVHPRLMVVGTSWGSVHLFDAMGQSKTQTDFKMHGHRVNVSQISVDHKGEYVGSCSGVDGRVIVTGICTSQYNLDFEVPGRRVYSVALDPLFFKSGHGRRVMTGDDNKVTMHEKVSNLFNRYKQTTLGSPNDGPIKCIKWRGKFVAWTCRRGVVVYDVEQERVISIVKYDKPIQQTPTKETESDSPESFSSSNGSIGANVTRLAWADQKTMFVTKGDSVKVCKVKKRSEPQEQLRLHDLPDFYVSIKSSFKLKNYWVSGIAPKDGGKHVLLLTVSKEDPTRPPRMMLVEPHSRSYTRVSVDDLGSPEHPVFAGYQSFTPEDYQLECCLDDSHYFIMAPSGVVMGRPRDVDDNIDWKLDHGDFAGALQTAEANSRLMCRHTALKVGKTYLDNLLDQGDFEEAAELCVRVFKNEKRLWQDEAIVRFKRLGQLRWLAPRIPYPKAGGGVRLENKYYEVILRTLLENQADNDVFLELIRGRWTLDMYNINELIEDVLEICYGDPDNLLLNQALAALYTNCNRHNEAMALYLKLQHHEVFTLIRDHDLFGSLGVSNRIPDLMDLDARESVKMFLEYREKLDPESVVEALEETEGNGRHLYLYLDALWEKDREGSRDFQGRLVRLYAVYNQKKLMSFLDLGDYDLEDALDTCQEHGLTQEQIFIYTRMGNTKRALQLIIDELIDIDEAIRFCKEHDDEELWDMLVDYAVHKPTLIYQLLTSIGTHVHPKILIEKIELGLEIPHLKKALAIIMQDYRLQVTLQEACKKIVESDAYTLITRQEEMQKRGSSVTSDLTCGICNQPIINNSPAGGGDVVVFMCRHAFHARCILSSPDSSTGDLTEEGGELSCPLCKVKRF